MKTVFSSMSQVAHVWAQQYQPFGRAGNVFFEGPTIYSYGRHLPIATFHTNDKGARCVLFTTRSYSVSTAKHIGRVRNALHGLGLPIFHVHNPTRPELAREDFQHRITIALSNAKGAKALRYQHLSEALALSSGYKEVADFFGFNDAVELPSDLADQMAAAKPAHDRHQEQVQARRANADSRRQARWAEIERQNAMSLEEKIAEWRAGKNIELFHYSYSSSLPTMLRANGNEIQTSRGASIPLEHGRRAYQFLKRLHDKGENYHHNGHTIHVGQFTIDSLDGGTISAGCHRIAWDEVERLAKELNW